MKIASYKELQQQIALTKAEKVLEELNVQYAFQEFVHTLNPVSIFKNSIHNLTQDKEVQVDLTKAALNVGANFIIDKSLGKFNSIKGFISSLVVENISKSFINNNSSKIISLIGKLF